MKMKKTRKHNSQQVKLYNKDNNIDRISKGIEPSPSRYDRGRASVNELLWLFAGRLHVPCLVIVAVTEEIRPAPFPFP